MSERYVYALNTHGEVLVRFGVSPDNPGGDYWKKVPGAFKEITGKTISVHNCHDGQIVGPWEPTVTQLAIDFEI